MNLIMRNAANDKPSDQILINYMKVGATSMDTEAYITEDTFPNRWNYRHLSGALPDDIFANANLKPTIGFTRGETYSVPSSEYCNIDKTDCYHVRVHPNIKTVSANTGYIGGGQTITITGNALNGTTHEVLVDGTACVVQSSSYSEIKCITGGKNDASKAGKQPGQ